MSTKTAFKRIALVAISALGIGLLSAIPSQAVSGLTVTVTDGTATVQKADSTTAGSIVIAGTVDAKDSITVTALLVSAPSGANSTSVFQNGETSTPTLANYRFESSIATASVQTGAFDTFYAAVTSPNKDIDTVTATGGTPKQLRISTVYSAAYINQTILFQLDSTTGTATRLAGTYTYQIVVKSFNKGSSNNALGVADNTTTSTIKIVVTDAVTASSGTAAVAGQSTAIMSAASSGAWQQTDIDSVVSGSSLAAVTSTGAIAVILLTVVL